MLRSIEASLHRPRAAFFGRLRRRSRLVRVEVLWWGLVADSFQASDPATLKTATTMIYKHLPETGGTVRIIGIERSGLPFGLAAERREIALDNLGSALCFLEG